ncbi:hypothetical protein [Paraglaciecola sp. MB-3u-78]|jgi:hypothetical protein|uniref:hypothetical protein n=1 Tax=Paraglaciecola sp. MB-3u-78 TaxID=2058332 RepID=UPI000C3293A0|nr:hypothetical protein [Paraglaciecola sp. MB-3u-78]PKG99512.1 hypothetical protein CXF95_09800 [Paraglaciecola sp. MB-3u-78]
MGSPVYLLFVLIGYMQPITLHLCLPRLIHQLLAYARALIHGLHPGGIFFPSMLIVIPDHATMTVGLLDTDCHLLVDVGGKIQAVQLVRLNRQGQTR